jgi:hypothetical protein
MTDVTAIPIVTKLPATRQSRALIRTLTPTEHRLRQKVAEQVQAQIDWHLKSLARAAIVAELERLIS